jgi:hypothetical protein
MPRAQTGITPLPPKHALILSFSVEDLPLKAMSIGHIAANVPGLVNELRASDSDLLYSIGLGSLLWNFIWQGNMPPGFRPLELDGEDENDEEEENDEEDETDGSDLTFCFFSSNSDLLHQLAEESQTHLKNVARVNEMVFANLVESPKKENTADAVLIDPKYPEFAQSSFLFTLGLSSNSKPAKTDHETLSQNLAKYFHSLAEKESCLIHHLYSAQTDNECKHYLLALSNSVDPFQKILDTVLCPSADSLQTPLQNLEITPALHFLPSLEILAALRMGTLRMGPLSPTAKWK